MSLKRSLAERLGQVVEEDPLQPPQKGENFFSLQMTRKDDRLCNINITRKLLLLIFWYFISAALRPIKERLGLSGGSLSPSQQSKQPSELEHLMFCCYLSGNYFPDSCYKAYVLFFSSLSP